MSKNSGIISKLDWEALVDDALIKRKEARITQKHHAALAGVSIPTMISFEKAETTISLQKVLDILNVVGLVAKHKPKNHLEIFARDAALKWFELTKHLDNNDPAKHYYGHKSYSFQIEKPSFDISYEDFNELLVKTASVKLSGWSPFWIPRSEDIKPYSPEKNIVECWLAKENHFDRSYLTTDFWRASKDGFFYLQRGYKEDDICKPKEVFDLYSPVREAVEVIFYAIRFAQNLKINPSNKITFNLEYKGLQGRTIANLSDPLRPLLDKGKVAQRDSITMSTEFLLNEINEPFYEPLAEIAMRLLKELYSEFGFFELEYSYIEHIVKDMFSRMNQSSKAFE